MRKLVRFVLVCSVFTTFAACHARAADTPRSVTPTVDLEIEDRGADKSVHVTRFSLSLVNGHAKLSANDGDAKYYVEAEALPATEPRFAIKLDRHAHAAGEVGVTASIPQRQGPRILVAKVDRDDGRMTTVVAQVR